MTQTRNLPGLGDMGVRQSGAFTATVRLFTRTAIQNWTVTATGVWRFVAWGAGAGGQVGGWGGKSGSMFIAERKLSEGQLIIVAVGAGGAPSAGGSNTTITLPSGEVLTAGAGTSGAVGVAIVNTYAGDLILAGSLGGNEVVASSLPGANGLGADGGLGGAGYSATSGGAGAPGMLGYQGGRGGAPVAGLDFGGAPGAGGAESTVGSGGDGLVIIQRVR